MKERYEFINSIDELSSPIAGIRSCRVIVCSNSGETTVPGIFSYNEVTKKLVDRSKVDEFIESLDK